jgi:proteasome lid subunit RPN8/RPN11
MELLTIPINTLDEIRYYFKTCEKPELEHGCLITRDWQVIPFENCAKEESKGALIQQLKDEDVILMADLLENDNLFAWAHSHPSFAASPSSTDIMCHELPCAMLIWSGITDSFTLLSAAEILDLRAQASARWAMAASIDADVDGRVGKIWKCVSMTDSTIMFSLDAANYTNAVEEAMQRLGWDVIPNEPQEDQWIDQVTIPTDNKQHSTTEEI